MIQCIVSVCFVYIWSQKFGIKSGLFHDGWASVWDSIIAFMIFYVETNIHALLSIFYCVCFNVCELIYEIRDLCSTSFHAVIYDLISNDTNMWDQLIES